MKRRTVETIETVDGHKIEYKKSGDGWDVFVNGTHTGQGSTKKEATLDCMFNLARGMKK